jgi:hypothetical protein
MKRWVAVASLAAALMFVSLLYAQHVTEISYEAINYGWPLPWLVYYIANVMPVNYWLPNVFGLVVDSAFWLVVSLAIVSTISMFRARTTKSGIAS